MSEFLKNTTVIIRSVDERTEQVCKKLILEQGVSEDDLFIIKEVPFSKSMRKSFETGIKQGKKWTLCIDADVLLKRNSIHQLIEAAESHKENVCEIQGKVLDKFFSGPRDAGNHLFRTSLLQKVIDRIPPEGTDIRPETFTLNRMKEDGYPWIKIPLIVGIHDDEQFNYDIYRKAFVQAVKHLDRADLLVNHWKKNCHEDHDFKVALTAFSDSIKNTGEVFIKSDQDLYKKMFKKSGFKEKSPLKTDEFSLDVIDKRIDGWEVDDKYFSYFPDSGGLDSRGKVAVRKIKSSLKKRGVAKTIALTISRSLKKIGNMLERRIAD